MKLIFATNNQHKVDEIRAAMKEDTSIKIVTLQEAGINIDIPEPYLTLEENARGKSRVIYEMTNTACFSEDTGLEVEALNGEPGVKSARYAGDDRSFEANIQKLLMNLEGKTQRQARFRTIISLITGSSEVLFEGICPGKILDRPQGVKGFGYDSVFMPEGANLSFAEMDMDQKNEYSHRKKAMDKLLTYLKNPLKA